jgi:membrane associated rhomboid family serine protease
VHVISLIPVHDANPTRRVPVVTYLLLAANVLVFLAEPVAGQIPLLGGPVTQADACGELAYFHRWAAIPAELTRNEQLPQTVGQSAGPGRCLLVAPEFEKIPFVSVLTAMFLHGGWMHLLGNMLYLFIFGNNVEDRLGHVRFLLFYLVCGYLATYAFAFSQPDSTTTLVGASGAIAGVLGAYLLLFPRAKVTALLPFLLFLPARLPAWVVLGSWFVLQYVYFQGAGVSGQAGVAYLAHVAGFIAGMLGVVVFGGFRSSPPPSPPVPPSPGWPPPSPYR